MSQRAFAKKIGMSASYLADVERGARNISLNNIRRIADGFGMSVGELMETLRDYE